MGLVPRIHPRVNTTNYFSAFWKEGQRKPSRCTRKRTLILLRILAVLPVSRPGVPPGHYRYRLGLARWSGSQTARRSVPTIYQRMAARPVWTGDAIYGV